MFERFLYRLVYILFGLVLWMALMSKANALDILIYHSNYAYTDTKSGLEGQGHTVTGSTSTTVDSASTLANYDVVIDQLYNNNCGSTCRDNYDTYVKNGGHLIIVGENSGFSNRNTTIESLIENKFGGTLDLGSNVYGGSYYSGGTNNTVNTSVSDADDGGQYIAGSEIASTSDGLWLAKTSNGAIIWMMWRGDDLPSGYTGSVTVTFDINQFQSNYDSDATFEYVDDVMYYGENGAMASSTPTYSSAPTSAQLQSRTDARNITPNGNEIYITQSGDNLDLDITQYDNDQLVAGTGSTSSNLTNATITGDDNTVAITQGNSAGSFSDNNVTLLDINGTNNSVTVRQGDNVDDAGGHRSSTNVVGNYNTIGILQENDGGVGSNGHFMDIDISGNSNTVYADQKDDGDKMLFLDVNGASNTIDILQQGTGEHFLDVTLGSNQTVDITQDGSGSHAATINMSGYTSGLTLSQSGTTDQTYSLNQICTNSNGCGTTTVNQQ
jgi:hypothetical protein